MSRRLIAAGWLRRRHAPRVAPEPLQVVTTRRPPGHHAPDPGITWLTARDIPLPAHPPDVVVFGPGRPA